MAGLRDYPKYMRETGQKLGTFATACAICQWEMQVDSELEMSLSRARWQLSRLFLCLYVWGFCCFEKTYGSVSLFLT